MGGVCVCLGWGWKGENAGTVGVGVVGRWSLPRSCTYLRFGTGGCGPTHQERVSVALRGGPLCSLDRGLTAVECR